MLFSIFTFFQCFTPYSRLISIWVSFSAFLSFFTIIQVLQSVFLNFDVFHCFSPFSRSYSVWVSFYSFVSFLTIFQVLQCSILYFTRFSDSRHNSGPTVCISHFFLRFSLFLSIFHVLHCVFLILQFFQCFSPYSRYYNVSFSIFC